MKKEEFLAMNLPFDLMMAEINDDGLIVRISRLYPSRYHDFATHDYYKPCFRKLFELEAILLSEFEKYHKNIDYDNEIIELFCEEHIKTSDLISEINIESLPFDTVIWMIKNHFDIAGLIEKGEAIDVNTLSENPYK